MVRLATSQAVFITTFIKHIIAAQEMLVTFPFLSQRVKIWTKAEKRQDVLVWNRGWLPSVGWSYFGVESIFMAPVLPTQA